MRHEKGFYHTYRQLTSSALTFLGNLHAGVLAGHFYIETMMCLLPCPEIYVLRASDRVDDDPVYLYSKSKPYDGCSKEGGGISRDANPN